MLERGIHVSPVTHRYAELMLGGSYLEHLTQGDLSLLADNGAGAGTGLTADTLRSRPELIEPLLRDPAVFDAVFARGDQPPALADSAALVHVSPFLVFAVAVARAADELRHATHVLEWFGPRRRIPLLGPSELRDFLSDSARRLFLSELLASYTHVASGAVFVRTPRGLRRRRFNELDPVRLASLLEVVPPSDRPGIYRRLGDLALFLTGVFPDHTATRGLTSLTRERLARLSEVANTETDAMPLFEALGRRWYHLAASSVPPPLVGSMKIVDDLAHSFGQARRALNLVTDRYLFPLRDQWFGQPAA